MERSELLLEYLTKKKSPSVSNINTNQKCDMFTGLFRNKTSYSDGFEYAEKLEKKLNDSVGLGTIMGFEEQLNQIICKFPFFHIRLFLEDYLNGVYKSQIVENYQLTSIKDIQEIIKILKLPKRKEKSKINDISGDARLTNKKNHQDIFDEFFENYDLFKSEIDDIYFLNILKSKIIFEIIASDIKTDELNQKKITSFNEFSFLNNILLKTSDKTNELTFNQLEIFFKHNLNSVLEKLVDESLIKNESTNLIFNGNFDESKIIDFLIEQISINEKGLSYIQIINLMFTKFDYFYNLPHYSLLKSMLENLEKENKIKSQKESNNKNGFTERHFFSSIFYTKQIKNSKKNEHERIQFFGRPNVSGFDFIYELKRLARGELDDNDDQVTRIAGLILSTNQKIMASSKSHNLFEISTDVIHYQPTPEEEKLMSEMDFILKPETEVMHVKIMLDEKITMPLLEKLSDFSKSYDGVNSQIIIISFEDNDVFLGKLPDDKSVQIINKKELSRWIDLVPIIPCRKGTVVKIMRGEEFRSIAKILRMHYDTGTAVLEQIGTGNEITAMIADIEEINLRDQLDDDYSLLHNNFFSFLNSSIKLSNHNLVEKTVFEFKVNDFETCENEYYLDYTTKYDDFDDDTPLRVNLSKQMDSTTINHTVKIMPSITDKNKIFDCTCHDFVHRGTTADLENLKICEHLIVILIDIGISNNLFSETWGRSTNPINQCLKKFGE
jgi:hypothetical protein